MFEDAGRRIASSSSLSSAAARPPNLHPVHALAMSNLFNYASKFAGEHSHSCLSSRDRSGQRKTKLTFRGLPFSPTSAPCRSCSPVPAFIGLSVVQSSLYDVPGGYRAVMFDRFSGVSDKVSLALSAGGAQAEEIVEEGQSETELASWTPACLAHR